MIFHVPVAEMGMAPKVGDKDSSNYILSIARILIGIVMLMALLALAFFAYSQGWSEGTTVLLHMSEVTFGGMIGIVFGERMGLQAKNK